jgi:hypothetical protein
MPLPAHAAKYQFCQCSHMISVGSILILIEIIDSPRCIVLLFATTKFKNGY